MFVEVEVEQASNGLVLNWNASITNGVERDVKLRYGYRVSGTDVYLNEQIVSLDLVHSLGKQHLATCQAIPSLFEWNL